MRKTFKVKDELRKKDDREYPCACGGEGLLRIIYEECYILCDSCGAYTLDFKYVEDAANAWKNEQFNEYIEDMPPEDFYINGDPR